MPNLLHCISLSLCLSFYHYFVPHKRLPASRGAGREMTGSGPRNDARCICVPFSSAKFFFSLSAARWNMTTPPLAFAKINPCRGRAGALGYACWLESRKMTHQMIQILLSGSRDRKIQNGPRYVPGRESAGFRRVGRRRTRRRKSCLRASWLQRNQLARYEPDDMEKTMGLSLMRRQFLRFLPAAAPSSRASTPLPVLAWLHPPG